MQRPIVLTLAMMFGLALTSLHAQDKEKTDSINDKVLRQVEKALKKFEGDLEKGKIDTIMKSVEQALDGKSIHFEWFGETPEGILDADHLPKQLKILKKKIGDVDGEMIELVPRLIELSNAKTSKENNRKVVGVMLESNDDKVVVQKVIEKSPAKKAGLKSGDIIIKVDGKEIKDPQGLIEVVEESGKELKFAIKRDGKPIEIKVTPESASKVPGFNRSIIRLSKDGNLVEMEDVDGLIELHSKDLDGLHEKLIEGAKGNIFRFAPGKKGEKMELRLKSKSDSKSEKKVKRESANDKVVEEKIELKNEGSSTAKAIEKLQQQLEKLEKEISKLKKDF